MDHQKTLLPLRGVKLTWVLLALAGSLALGAYGWRIYTLFRAWQVHTPQLRLEKLVNDLRFYHAHTGRFPSDFTQVNALVWHSRPAPDYGPAGRQARDKNYYYFYTRVNDGVCAVWALPIGPRRQDGAAYFIVLTPQWLRSWRGPALTDEVIRQLPAIPKPDQLLALRMQALPARAFNPPQSRGAWQ